MAGASTSSPPAMASINDVSDLLQNAQKYEELNVIGTGILFVQECLFNNLN